MNKPNAFIIGAPKCGTTSLAGWLSQHDQVFFSPLKEPYTMGSDIEGGLSFSDYLGIFEEVPEGVRAVMEGSTWYLWSEDAVDNILREFGPSKFIVCLRNPTEVAWSSHGQELYNARENISDFDEAWDAQLRRSKGIGFPGNINNPRRLLYGETCALGTMLERLVEKVEINSILFIFLDDMAASPKQVLSDVETFLGLDHRDVEFSVKNQARQRRSRVLGRFLGEAARVKRVLGLSSINFGLATFLSSFNSKSSGRGDMPVDTRAYLQDFFEKEVGKVEVVTGRNLSHWKN